MILKKNINNGSKNAFNFLIKLKNAIKYRKRQVISLEVRFKYVEREIPF